MEGNNTKQIPQQVRWFWWDNDKRMFVPYSLEDSQIIESAQTSGQSIAFIRNSQYKIDLKKKEQISVSTGYNRKIIRATWFWLDEQRNKWMPFNENDADILEKHYAMKSWPQKVPLEKSGEYCMFVDKDTASYHLNLSNHPRKVSRGYIDTSLSFNPEYVATQQKQDTKLLPEQQHQSQLDSKSPPCQYGICCYDQNGLHRTKYSHPTQITMPNLQNSLTRDLNKTSLINPLDNLPMPQRWWCSPNVKVMAGEKYGTLRGWEMQDKCKKTGKLFVTLAHDMTTNAYDPQELQLKKKTEKFNTPWYHDRVHVYRANYVSLVFDQLMSRKVNGLDITFIEVFKAITMKGYPVFIIGGAVRDIILGKSINEVKDIDISFGCSAEELGAIAQENKWFFFSSFTGLVHIGTEGNLSLEGKSIGCHSFDVENWRVGSLGSIGTDLTYEILYRDYTINTLCYDPFNKVVLDPTGRGVADCASHKICIPTPFTNLRSLWVIGNPTKILRYWKLLCKGYEADTDTKKFIIECALDQTLVKPVHWKNAKYSLQKGSGSSVVSAWRSAIEKDLGIDYVLKMLGPP